MIIHALRDFYLGQAPASTSGFIFVNGGRGGNSNVPGGPGGGGGGGGIQVFVGRNIEIFNTDGGGASGANNGVGGTNSLFAVGANGGMGRSWFSSVGYNLVGGGFYTPAEQVPVVPGNVEFLGLPQQVTSQILDLRSTRATIDSLTPSPLSSDFTLEASGSSDAFVSDNTGWTSDFSLLKNKRYFRFRITVTTSNVNDPTMLDTLLISYSANNIEDFDFEAAGCGIVQGKPFPPQHLLLLIFPLFFIGLLKLKTQ